MAVIASRVSVGTTATALHGAEADTVSGGRATITNRDGTASVDIGPSDVASGAGYELKAGETVTVELGSGDRLYGIAASGTVVCHVLLVG